MTARGGESGDGERPGLTAEDIAQRIGAVDAPTAAPAPAAPAGDPSNAAQSDPTLTGTAQVVPGLTRVSRSRSDPRSRRPPADTGGGRAVLWRDAAGFAALILAIALGIQLGVIGGPPTPTRPGETQSTLGATATPYDPRPLGSPEFPPPTLGPAVDPGLGLDTRATPSATPRAARSARPGSGGVTATPPPVGPSSSPSTSVQSPAPSSPTAQPSGSPSAPPSPGPAASPVIITFLCSPTSGGAPLHVDCSATGTDVDTWTWDFGDGVGTGSGPTTSYTYAAAGTYTLTVTASGPGGTDTRSVVITVSP